MKECSHCKEMLSLDKFYTTKRYDKRYKQEIYVNARCIKCTKKQQKKHRDKPEVKIRNGISNRKWKEQNKEFVKKYDREYRREWRKNPINRLQSNISSLVSHSLKQEGIRKDDSFWNIIGYTIDELKEHLEKQFIENMSWDNYGEWHLDHIKPKSLFNIKEFGDEEFIGCWSMENLQPLWARENMSKGDKYEL